MAIAFARLEFVKRSSGKNACTKAAYNSRGEINFKGTSITPPSVYNWTHKEKPLYHEVLLPNHVDSIFQSSEYLWNAVELSEKRVNSQTALELVVALPDDLVISLEDRAELTKTFVQEHFVDKGLAAQIDIHQPEKKEGVTKGSENEETLDHNWHAHVLVTTRRFKQNGKEFEEHKARDLMPVLRGGQVISGPNWGKLWAQHQNLYFEQKGLSLRVDPNGATAQKHLGPTRMRGRAFSLLHENDLRISLNAIESKDPNKILNLITENKSIFTPEDVDRFLQKHVSPQEISTVREDFWSQKDIVQLVDKISKDPLSKFSTKNILEEERRTIRLADRMHGKKSFEVSFDKAVKNHSSSLKEEQKNAFQNILRGSRLTCIEGHAGTGKSYLLTALKETYQSEGYIVRAFGPDNATSEVLKEKGFQSAENIYRFLFKMQNEKVEIKKNKEVWLIDEAGKLGTRPLLELLKAADKKEAQVILSGNSAQFSSVDRGGMFKIFCEKYGAQVLEEISRQKDANQREIAQQLAYGKPGAAIDSLSKAGGLHWEVSKEKAIESLIGKWIKDRIAFPDQSFLILAHSNAEVRALNELVRTIRKEAGEIDSKEYLCQSSLGKIYVSVGDRIEFRGNNKELGVSNGMHGILTRATEDKFTVQMKEGEKTRVISFNPSEFASFQLGYASTQFRSQGGTFDRVYVLHSSMMNKPAFYVSLTRHVWRADLFISKEEISGVADLKRQAFRKNTNESTLEFLTKDDIEKHNQLEQKNKHIQELKVSDSMLTKLKGFGLSTWEELKEKTSEVAQRFQDRRPDQEFFNPKLSKERFKGEVVEVKEFAPPSDNLVVDAEQAKKEFALLRDQQNSGENASIALSNQKSSIRKEAWQKLPEESKALLKDYYRVCDQTSSLRTVVLSEAEVAGTNEKSAPHFKEWQAACLQRNEKAYSLLVNSSNKDIRKLFDGKGLEILQDRSARHEATLQKSNSPTIDLDEKLKENLEALLYRLFPEGPTSRDAKSFRFGGKGSLAVICRGEKAGSFFDFENQVGGGPLQLVQRVLGRSLPEAKEWANKFLGSSQDVTIPSQFAFKKNSLEKEGEWVSLKADAKVAPTLRDLSKQLNVQYQESARYCYRDENGNALFYMLRLVEKQDPTKKIVIPMTYGYWKGADEESRWCLKGYQTQERPLYNLHLLREHPSAKILVVEGEKTTDAANKMFSKEGIICLTWSGGAGAVNRTDWQPLFGRDVIIWPDNDSAGFKAANGICLELRKVGVASLKQVNQDILTKEFPQKWDLSDPLPAGKNGRFIDNLLARADEKIVGLRDLSARLGIKESEIAKDPLIAQLRINEVLWRVEERMRPDLECRFGTKTWEIDNAILKEVATLLNGRSSLEEKIKKEMGVSADVAKLISSQATIYQARTGKEPSQGVLENTNQVINQCLAVAANVKINPEHRDFIFERVVTSSIEMGRGKNFQKMLSQLAELETKNISNQIAKLNENSMQKRNQISLDETRNF